MQAGHFLFSVAVFGSLLPQASSSTDDAQQKSALTTDHKINLAGSDAGSSFLSSNLDLDKVIMDKRKAGLRRGEVLVRYEDHGQMVATSVGAADLSALSAVITSDTYKQHLSDFVSSGKPSRYIKEEGNSAAAAFLKKKLLGMNYEVHEIPWEESIKPPGVVNNIASIVAFKKGQDLDNEAFVVGAHYDSVNWEDTEKAAPGVDDNGSGVAGILSIAESLKDHSPRRNLILALYNAEEEGRFGSKSLVETLVNQKKFPQWGTIKGALILDEIAYSGLENKNQAIFETVGTVQGSQSLVDTLAHNVEDDKGSISDFMANWQGFGSDHISWLDVGVPAALLIERWNMMHADQVAHTDKDTFKGLSMKYGAKMARLALRTSVVFLNPKIGSETSPTASEESSAKLGFKKKLNPSAFKFQKARLEQKMSGDIAKSTPLQSGILGTFLGTL